MDTSVIGGCFDHEFAPWSNALLVPVLSQLVAAEIRPAPDPVREKYTDLLGMGGELVEINAEALDLATAYERHGALPPALRNDMLHIAIATVAEVDVLVSWNFKHIVRLDKIRLFNAVNLELSYKSLQIYSPREVTLHGRDRDQRS
ncbi:MAG TPA: PIN domain protein [Thermoanaerobaculia bacterium]|nr:PIN domain protein [Thermoanaerobaculia bacterium]